MSLNFGVWYIRAYDWLAVLPPVAAALPKASLLQKQVWPPKGLVG